MATHRPAHAVRKLARAVRIRESKRKDAETIHHNKHRLEGRAQLQQQLGDKWNPRNAYYLIPSRRNSGKVEVVAAKRGRKTGKAIAEMSLTDAIKHRLISEKHASTLRKPVGPLRRERRVFRSRSAPRELQGGTNGRENNSILFNIVRTLVKRDGGFAWLYDVFPPESAEPVYRGKDRTSRVGERTMDWLWNAGVSPYTLPPEKDWAREHLPAEALSGSL